MEVNEMAAEECKVVLEHASLGRLGCSYVSVAAYRAGGWDALRARKASGRPKRLTGSQLRWIYNTVTSKNPLQLQFPFALWTER